eukprot:7682033-Pyramimonas_sp.AAC.1
MEVAPTGILENRWPMAGSTAQWPHAKKLLRDIEVSLSAFKTGAILEKRVIDRLTKASEYAAADAKSMDRMSRLASTTGHIDNLLKLFGEVTPMMERYLSSNDVDVPMIDYLASAGDLILD